MVCTDSPRCWLTEVSSSELSEEFFSDFLDEEGKIVRSPFGRESVVLSSTVAKPKPVVFADDMAHLLLWRDDDDKKRPKEYA